MIHVHFISSCRRSEFDRRFESSFDPYKPCSTNQECGIIDMNMICSQQKKCACRPDMRWNQDTAECQIYMDVDCSGVNYRQKREASIVDEDYQSDEPSNATVSSERSADKGLENAVEILEGKNLTEVTLNDTLQDSGLTKIDLNKTTEVELKTEFCREINAVAQRYEVQLHNIPLSESDVHSTVSPFSVSKTTR